MGEATIKMRSYALRLAGEARQAHGAQRAAARLEQEHVGREPGRGAGRERQHDRIPDLHGLMREPQEVRAQARAPRVVLRLPRLAHHARPVGDEDRGGVGLRQALQRAFRRLEQRLHGLGREQRLDQGEEPVGLRRNGTLGGHRASA